jgi:hypothetical protein
LALVFVIAAGTLLAQAPVIPPVEGLPSNQVVFGSPGRFPDGTISLPGMSFAAEPSSGLYRAGAGSIGLSTLGVMRVLTDGANTYLAGPNGVTNFYQSNSATVINSSTLALATGGVVQSIAISSTVPTIASGFGTTPSVTIANGTAAFRINVGTGGTAQNGVVTMPAATTGWNCQVDDVTTPASFVTDQTASTTTSVTVQNYSRTTGLAIAWTASDVLAFLCLGF